MIHIGAEHQHGGHHWKQHGVHQDQSRVASPLTEWTMSWRRERLKW